MKMINRKTLLAAAFVAVSLFLTGCWAVAGSTECFFGSPNCNPEVSDSDAVSTTDYGTLPEVKSDSQTDASADQCMPAGHFMTKYVGRTVYCVIGDSGVAGLECGPVQILTYSDGICGFGCAGLPAGASLDEIKEETGGFRFVRFNGTTAHCKPVDTADTGATPDSVDSIADATQDSCQPYDGTKKKYICNCNGIPFDCPLELEVQPEGWCLSICPTKWNAPSNKISYSPSVNDPSEIKYENCVCTSTDPTSKK